MSDLTDLPASELSRRIHARDVSCSEVMHAYLVRIHDLNPVFNAIVNLAPDDELMAQANASDAELARGASRGWLHGIPIAVKDVADAKGFPTTRGCALLADNVASRNSVMVERLRAAGCIVIGKTNTPEFGLGSHTFNTLFGTTRNAWDRTVSAGGSSGGAAVCLAQHMLPVADGSDFMGSLRNPGGWNHVFGMRPTQGRVPMGPNADVWVDQLSTEGPMARTVQDLRRLLATQAGFDARLPLSLQSELEVPDEGHLEGVRIGWLADLGGYLPMDEGVLDACGDALRHMQSAGAVVEEIALGFDATELWDAWLTWRRALIGPRIAPLLALPDAREVIKPEALWEYDRSMSLPFMDFMRASQVRSSFYQHMRMLFGKWDVLALPSAQVWPFDVRQRWPKEIAGHAMDTYHRWMEVTTYATFAGSPAISVPAAFHPTNAWPMGLQLIAKHSADAMLLRVARGYEAVRADFVRQRPAEPVTR